jgi:hypothetical protein
MDSKFNQKILIPAVKNKRDLFSKGLHPRDRQRSNKKGEPHLTAHLFK